MKNISKQLDEKDIEKQILLKQIEIDKNKIQEFQTLISNSKNTLIETIIEILSFKLINFTKKYIQINKQYTIEISKIEHELNSLSYKLQNIKNDIQHLEEEFEQKILLYKNELTKFQNNLVNLSKYQYINNYTQIEILQKLNAIIKNKEKFMFHDKIKDYILEIINFYNNPQKWIDDSNRLFIQNEKLNEKAFFDTIESNPLTNKQQDAVLVNENNNLILAGAGSGKTSVIVAKVSYLLKKNILNPNEILILAFNKNAQEELEERFKQKNIHVQIKTFHSFGLSVIAKALSQKPDLCPMTESPINMTKFIKDTIRELMASMGTFFESFLDFIAYFSIPYKSEEEFNSRGEYYEYQKNYDMKTLKHKVEIKSEQGEESLTTLKEETVKSYQELIIANFFTLNGIRYLYEEPYKYKTYTVEKRQYKPDFYLPDYDIYIEHYGIDRDGKTAPYINNQEYLESMKWKRSLHKEKETICIETFSYEYTENTLMTNLKEKLLRYDIVFRKLTREELNELLKDPIENNKFVKLFTTFLNHYKSNMHSLDDLKLKAKDSERTTLFLKLFEFIFNEYKKFQERNNCIDFDDMIVKALESIENEKYKHGFKHIFIDEFQDISTTRARLIQKLLPINNTSITAVGDDWQSINRFAGSNIKIIQEFNKIFGITEVIALDYTFRFNNIVSNVASNFIQKNPHQIQKEIKTIKQQNQNKFSLLLYWTTGNDKNDLKNILDLIYKKEQKKNKMIMVLARYNFLFKDLKDLKEKYQNFNIIFSTVHSSKGNEADYVIILNINNGKFGFPSKIEDDPILNIVVPEGDDFEDAEERRLFYVALTRTKGTIFLLSNMYEQSIFIKELIDENQDEIFFLNDPKIQLMHCPECKTGFLKKHTKNNNKDKHFYGCSNFPRCKYTENIHYCPKCNSEVFKDKEAKIANCLNKDCDFQAELCIKCSGYMIERNGRYGDFLGCENYPNCDYTQKINKNNHIALDMI
ncbi:UvrD-helicase domain-containing protein [Sulfurimonas hydrogeniphila]|uniref:UvrD-helicase domain-containing protein n=1 Tax=Sulfurimonas hydrogeniphila TaxID=2509341 RepID=UPI00125FED02|nr:UvrD-helicase domain-containing protein [Sulfurimonas hydrogeniphila]